MSRNPCQFFTTEYRSQYIEKSQSRVRINRQSDCFAERVDESWQIDPKKASKITEIDDEARKKANWLILDTLRSVYRNDFTDPKFRNSSIPANDEEKNLGSELLANIDKLFNNPHEEKILAPPPTAKRVFGYMRPKFLHETLSGYQDVHGRTGGRIMKRNAEAARMSKKREALRNKKFAKQNTGDPCGPEKLADMHFT